jgi:hypothetical protein
VALCAICHRQFPWGYFFGIIALICDILVGRLLALIC